MIYIVKSIAIAKDGTTIGRQIIIDTVETPQWDRIILSNRESVLQLVNRWNSQAINYQSFPKHIYHLV